MSKEVTYAINPILLGLSDGEVRVKMNEMMSSYVCPEHNSGPCAGWLDQDTSLCICGRPRGN